MGQGWNPEGTPNKGKELKTQHVKGAILTLPLRQELIQERIDFSKVIQIDFLEEEGAINGV